MNSLRNVHNRRINDNLKILFSFLLAISCLMPFAWCDRIQKQQEQQLAKVFENCRTDNNNFDTCMKNAFNDLRVYFRTGMS